MPNDKIEQRFRDSSLSRSNMFKSLPELPTLRHCRDNVENRTENILSEPNRNDSQWQSVVKRQNAFEGDSSTPFWNSSQNANFNQCHHNVICSVFKLQSQLNGCCVCSIQPNSAHIYPALDSSSIPSIQQRSASGCMKQWDGKCFGAQDLSDMEHRKLTRQHFVMVFSICYAIFLVVFGSIVFIGDVVDSQYPLPQAFCIYMLLMALAYFLYLYIDIRMHICQVENELKNRMERNQLVDAYIKSSLNNDGTDKIKSSTHKGDVHTVTIHASNQPLQQAIPRRYSFKSEENSASFYVKMGALWFGFGLFIYSSLQVSYDVYFISSYGTDLHDCASYVSLALNIIFPLYSLFTLFFIVKYMNVVINVNRNVARIFLMHAIGTSLSLWVFTIIRETADAIAEFDSEKPGLHRRTEPNDTFEFVYNDCGTSNALSTIHRQFAPYLYPFVIEYCILAVGIWCKMYENIDNSPHKCVNVTTNATHEQSTQHEASSSEYCSMDEQKPVSDSEKALQSGTYFQANCSSNFNGIFFGLLLIIISVVFIILVFTGFKHKQYLKTSIMVNNIFECSILIILIISTTISYSQMVKLDINPNQTQRLQLDDLFLLISIPAYFLNSILALVPAFENQNTLRICISFLRFIEVLIQTPFIIDGRRRCLNSSTQQGINSKRQLIIFLAIANVALWVYHTFSGKTLYANEEGFSFYGYYLWNILNHICLPLTMFYRFHSSVCLVEIWNNTFKTSKKHK